MQFTHLHVHSNYTLLGGTASVESLAERAKSDGLSHLALTDTNSMIGVVAFARACLHQDVKPIVGMALSIGYPGSTGEAPIPPIGTNDAAFQTQLGMDWPRHYPAGQIVLLAKNRDGYRSLCALSSLVQGTPERSQRLVAGLTLELLKEHARGLICISGGQRGWIARSLLHEDEKAAARLVGRFAGIFDEDFYLALEGGTTQAKIQALSQQFGVATVAVQPIYILAPEERPKLRLLAAIDQNCHLDEVADASLPDEGDLSRNLHWLSKDEMESQYAQSQEALEQTIAIAEKCEPCLPDGQPIWPILKSPSDGTVIDEPDRALAQLAGEGLQEKFGDLSAAQKRLNSELDIINQHGYAPLFLLVSDIVAYALEKGIPVSTRGSVANSLVAYCCNITTVDPIEHDLLFERFLNPERSDPPDIDLDFCSRRRDEILNYVRDRYGADQVALVATISTLRPRSAIRETAKAYGLDESAIKRLGSMLSDSWHPDPRRRQKSRLKTILAELAEPNERAVIEAAFDIVGQPHHLSIHPGGVVVTPGPLTDYVPLQLAPKGFLTTQFEHTDVESIGLPKLDLLGIRALTVLSAAAELVQEQHDSTFRIVDIPSHDEATAQMLAQGETIGVFQCESSGAKRTLRQLNVRNVADLAVANAFFKPGPATGGLAKNFIRRYRGEEITEYMHDSLEPILRSTHGVLLFQEQILRVAREIAGLSWSEADHLRRGMSKFRAHEMESMRARFMDGCLSWHKRTQASLAEDANDDGITNPSKSDNTRQSLEPFTQANADDLWKQVVAFAGYGFNQGHATAYADVSYRSAYIKSHWPDAFVAARLANRGGFHHPSIYIAEAQRQGFQVRPPHVNHSGRRFTLQQENERPILWMGLGQVRSLRRESLQSIIRERQQGEFESVQDLISRVPLQHKETLHLIQCGALDFLNESGASYSHEGALNRLELLSAYDRLRRADSAQQLAFDFSEPAVEAEGLAQRIAWEQRILDQPVSAHPLEHATIPKDAASLTMLPTLVGEQVRIPVVRLPGWTGGRGSFFGDGTDYIIGRLNDSGDSIRSSDGRKVERWLPVLLTGRWLLDEWGGGWFSIEDVTHLELS